MTKAEIKAAVQRSLDFESSHDRHNAYPVRPVLCVVCEAPGTRGPMCSGCREAWLEGRPAV